MEGGSAEFAEAFVVGIYDDCVVSGGFVVVELDCHGYWFLRSLRFFKTVGTLGAVYYSLFIVHYSLFVVF
jgi:hypothetical protein